MSHIVPIQYGGDCCHETHDATTRGRVRLAKRCQIRRPGLRFELHAFIINRIVVTVVVPTILRMEALASSFTLFLFSLFLISGWVETFCLCTLYTTVVQTTTHDHEDAACSLLSFYYTSHIACAESPDCLQLIMGCTLPRSLCLMIPVLSEMRLPSSPLSPLHCFLTRSLFLTTPPLEAMNFQWSSYLGERWTKYPRRTDLNY